MKEGKERFFGLKLRFFVSIFFDFVVNRVELMGGRSSKEGSYRQNSSSRSTSSSWSYPQVQSPYVQSPYAQESQSYPPPQEAYPAPSQPYYPPSQDYGGARATRPTLERKYSIISDSYKSLDEVRLLHCIFCKLSFFWFKFLTYLPWSIILTQLQSL